MKALLVFFVLIPLATGIAASMESKAILPIEQVQPDDLGCGE